MNKYKCTFLLGLEESLEYRVNFALSLISTFFPIVIQTFLWTHIYNSPDAVIDNGYTYPQIILYSLLAGMVSKLVSTGFEYEVNLDIKEGGLNKYLIRPVSYLRYRLSAFLGKKVPAAGILCAAIAAAIIVAVTALSMSLTLSRVVLFAAALCLALLLNFIIFYCISMAGFWLTEIEKLYGTISIVLVVLSGGVFPLDIFGSLAARISVILPFSYTTQFPVNIVNGKLSMTEILTGMLVQAVWITALFILARILWNKGIRRYISAGG